MATRMQQRRGTASQWTIANPVLAAGEIGVESDTAKFKIGDGVNTWSSLDYYETATAAGSTFIEDSEKGANDGVATLDSTGNVPTAQLGNVDFTGYATETFVNTAITNLVDSAPATLDTLNELAAALGDDANFATTVTNSIATKQDDVITTEGDLVVGDNTGTAVRLPIGPADTVLTSNGTTAVWADVAGGGAPILYTVPNGAVVESVETLSVGLTYDFTFSGSGFNVSIVDDNENTLALFNSNASVNLTTEGAKIYFNNDTGSEQIVTRTNPVSADVEAVGETITVITSTQSVTLTEDTFVVAVGGGGGGGGISNQNSSGGMGGSGGGSGFTSSGILPAGTYTATIGAGGAGGVGFNDGSTGGTTSIGAISALGGNGGAKNVNNSTSGAGGSGGSGGGSGGATVDTGVSVDGGAGGVFGGAGEKGEDTPGATAGSAGSGSGDNIAGVMSVLRNNISYAGGKGGNVRSFPQDGADGAAGGGGGDGCQGDNNSPATANGGSGGDGVIILVTGQ